MRILGYELAGEGLFQNGLSEDFGAGECGIHLSVQLFGGLKTGVENSNDLSLFGGGADGDI